jgi:hypothetical protein
LGPAGPGQKRLIVNNVVEFASFFKADGLVHRSFIEGGIPNGDSLSKMNYELRKKQKMSNEPNFRNAGNECNYSNSNDYEQ